ncbi:MAG TPA: DUF5666 domain-containing protein [Chloroflexia bacterium]|nr:DUF5666 domain-containing protein [Chloroflexia bacterium]
MTRLKTYASLGAALVALGIGGLFTGSASAQTPGGAQRPNPHPVRLQGEVKAVGTNSITLNTRGGEVTANVGPNTWIVVQKPDGPGQGSISDLKPNMPATVAGMTTNDPRVVDARTITQGVGGDRRGAGRHRGPGPANVGGGTIKSISGNTLTVTNHRGRDVQVETTADTVVLDSGFKTVSALKAGDRVQVLGVPQRVNRDARPTPDNLKVNAWAVRVVRPGVELVGGQVEAVSGNTVTLKRLRNADGLPVNLSATTEYRKLTISATERKATLGSATQADAKAGSHIVVEGTRSADGKTFNATSVIIVPGKGDTAPQV